MLMALAHAPRRCPILLAVLLASHSATSAHARPSFRDCPDSWWDCLLGGTEAEASRPSGGGYSFGNCATWTGRCVACNTKDVSDVDFILSKCNSLGPECDDRCTSFADLAECCTRLRERPGIHRANAIDLACGNLDTETKKAQACGTA